MGLVWAASGAITKVPHFSVFFLLHFPMYAHSSGKTPADQSGVAGHDDGSDKNGGNCSVSHISELFRPLACLLSLYLSLLFFTLLPGV